MVQKMAILPLSPSFKGLMTMFVFALKNRNIARLVLVLIGKACSLIQDSTSKHYCLTALKCEIDIQMSPK